MGRSPSIFKQSDLTKILKSFRDAGYSAPIFIIEPQRLTVKPAELANEEEINQWDV